MVYVKAVKYQIWWT